MPNRWTSSLPRSLCVSLLVHVAVIVALGIGVGKGQATARTQSPERARVPDGIIWIAQGTQLGTNHGGGGGGDHTKSPPRRVELPGTDALTVPVGRRHPVSLQPPAAIPAEVAPPIAQLDISALRTAAGTTVLPGAVDGVPSGTSRGPGSGEGAGGGEGPGDGPGRGPGRGPGSGGQEGGGPAQPGTPGLQIPKVVREVKPAYTPEAMHAQIQGTVAIECVVTADGTVGNLRIVKSLDAIFGLDREAEKAARQWRFIPGRLRGHPVPVLVRIDLDFALR